MATDWCWSLDKRYIWNNLGADGIGMPSLLLPYFLAYFDGLWWFWWQMFSIKNAIKREPCELARWWPSVSILSKAVKSRQTSSNIFFGNYIPVVPIFCFFSVYCCARCAGPSGSRSVASTSWLLEQCWGAAKIIQSPLSFLCPYVLMS